MSTFSGINIARLGMQAQQKALEVTSHNVANANTEGYSRQIAKMVTTTPNPYPEGKGMVGTGVAVTEITRVRDEFLDGQIRKEMQTQSQWNARSEILEQLEIIFMEPSDTGFNTVLSDFFDSWQELSLNPESTPVRTALIEKSNTLVNSVQHINGQLKTIRSDIDDKISLRVMEVNTIAEQIKGLNSQIVRLVALKEMPGDLMDRRDLLLDQLSGLVDVRMTAVENGAVNVSIDGRSLVNEGSVNKLAVEPSLGVADDWELAPRIVWEETGQQIDIANGEIGGLYIIRDDYLKEYKDNFEGLAWGVVAAVNNLHRHGMDVYGEKGTDFFTGGYIETFSVNTEIKDDVGKIAAASLAESNNPGDGNNALNIARLKNCSVVVDLNADNKNRIMLPVGDRAGITTFSNFYRDEIARIGVDAQESNRMEENQEALLGMMKARKESISGVSLDEELANMIQFQLAYQASARVVTTFDEILDTIINNMIR